MKKLLSFIILALAICLVSLNINFKTVFASEYVAEEKIYCFAYFNKLSIEAYLDGTLVFMPYGNENI